MSLSSGGWTRTSPDFSADQAAAPSCHEAPVPKHGCQTVLMSVPVSVCHSGIRPLCLPGAGDESLRLQLSMDPGKSGDFRLSIQHSSGTGRTVVSPRRVVVCFQPREMSPKVRDRTLISHLNEGLLLGSTYSSITIRNTNN